MYQNEPRSGTGRGGARNLLPVATIWMWPMQADDGMSKVPAVTLAFWVIKVIATTLGRPAVMRSR